MSIPINNQSQLLQSVHDKQQIKCRTDIRNVQSSSAKAFPHIQKQIENKLALKIRKDILVVFDNKYLYVSPPLSSSQNTVVNEKIITKIFANCTFYNLQQLFIIGLDLQNCEFIQFLNAPILNEVSLPKSQYTNLKPFGKATIRPERLHFQKNFIKETPQYERININEEMSSLSLEFVDNGEVLHQDICPIIKIEAILIKSLMIFTNNRIKQTKVYDVMSRRFWTGETEDQKIKIVYKK